MDPRVRKPQPIELPPVELNEGAQQDWSEDWQEPPVTRSSAVRWALAGAVTTIFIVVAVSLFVALTDPSARTQILTTLIGAVFGLPATLGTAWALHEKHRSNRSSPRRTRRRKR